MVVIEQGDAIPADARFLRARNPETNETPLADEKRRAILDRNRGFATDALRVLGFARKEVPDAVADCRTAGIRVIVVPGDEIGFDAGGY